MVFRDIIDHEFAEGNIFKMLVGSLDAKVDGEMSTVTGDDMANDVSLEDSEQLVTSPSALSPGVTSPSRVGQIVQGSGGMFTYGPGRHAAA
jgi:hypothetical protein